MDVKDFETRLDSALESGFRKYGRGMLAQALRGLFSPRKRYARMLANLAHHGDSVEVVIRLASDHAAQEPDLQADLRMHAEEETGHGRIAAKDLKVLNVEEEYKTSLSPSSAQIALSAYTREVAVKRPVALLGFLAAAEGLTYRYAGIGLRGLRRIGVPETALTFLKLHDEVDRDHFPQLRKLALRHARTKEDQEAVLEVVRVSGDLLTLAQRY